MPPPMSSASSLCRVCLVFRLPWIPPGLPGLAMLNWLGWRSNALVSATSNCSFSRISRFFRWETDWTSRSRMVSVSRLYSSAASWIRKSRSCLMRFKESGCRFYKTSENGKPLFIKHPVKERKRTFQSQKVPELTIITANSASLSSLLRFIS